MKRRIVVGIGNAGPLHCNKCPMGEGKICTAFQKTRRAEGGLGSRRLRLMDCLDAQAEAADLEDET